MDHFAAKTLRIALPKCLGPEDTLPKDAIYPTRKSRLEIILDGYFFRESRDTIRHGMKERLGDRFTFVQDQSVWRSYPLASKWFDRPTLSIENQRVILNWTQRSNKNYTTLMSGKVKQFELREETNPQSVVDEALDYYYSGEGLPSFKVSIFGDRRIDAKLSQMFEWLFDGLTEFPYSRSTRSRALLDRLTLFGALPDDIDLKKAGER